jgi:hypothetical protein
MNIVTRKTTMFLELKMLKKNFYTLKVIKIDEP